jgi:hypothetical protein
MKNSLLILFLLHSIIGYGQCPVASVDLLSQADVNAFPTNYPGCSTLPDGIDLKIMGNDITDLTPLLQLTHSDGIIEIRDCPLLTNLEGLNNITQIGNDLLDGFILRDLPLLTDITALNTLNTVNGEFTIRTCATLTSLNGLNHLKHANGSLIIRENQALVNLNGLDSLIFIGETLELVDNTSLIDIQALQNVDSIIGGIEGGVFIEANTLLSSLQGLGNNTTSIGSNLDLTLNGNLAICSVPSICNYLSNPPIGAIITITTNEIGCNSQTEIENGCVGLGIEKTDNSARIFIMESNIVNDQLKVYSNQNCTIQIVDLLGQSHLQYLTMGKNELDISSLPNGILFIYQNNGKNLKLVKL